MAYGVTNCKRGGGAVETCALWKPHWDISEATMTGYATSGKISILVRDDMYFACTINTSSGQYRATIYGSSGSPKVVDTNDNVQFIFNYLAVDLPTAYPDTIANLNGYGTYIIVFELLTGGATITTFNITTYVSTFVSFGALWGIWNNTFTGNTFQFVGNPNRNFFLECVQFLSGGILSSAFSGCRSLVKAVGFTHTDNTTGITNFSNCHSLKEVDNILNASILTDVYNSCYVLDNDISGTYPRVTSMSAFIVNNFGRSKGINITAPLLTNFGGNDGCYSVPSVYIDAPLTVFGMRYAANSKTLTLVGTNFKSLGTTTNAIDIRDWSLMSATEITNFITALEDLTGYTAQNILKANVTNWNAGHTAAANAKNWNVV